VDELGGLDDALSIAKEQAGFAEADKVNLIVLPKQRPLFEQLIEQIIEGTEGSIQLEGWKIGRLEGWGFQPSLLPAFHFLFGTQWQHAVTWLSLFGFENGTQIVTILPYDILIR